MPFTPENRWTTFLFIALFGFLTLAIGATWQFARQGMRVEAMALGSAVIFAFNGIFGAVQREINKRQILSGQSQVVKKTDERAKVLRTDLRHDVRAELQPVTLAVSSGLAKATAEPSPEEIKAMVAGVAERVCAETARAVTAPMAVENARLAARVLDLEAENARLRVNQ